MAKMLLRHYAFISDIKILSASYNILSPTTFVIWSSIKSLIKVIIIATKHPHKPTDNDINDDLPHLNEPLKLHT